ncbi:MAG: DUF4062 domain-containing protein [Deltaproteobacteria bacterium]|nr:DUF4062 domain-containing protein [Deltaproteobacteria bacterium]
MNNEDLFKDALPMDEKKYQIFVSSTYTDLIGAREAVATTILRLYHVPIGMEMFSAGDDKQWKIISETISASDYYIVIIGHRYGSETPEGISFTEKEYDYAKEKNIPVLAFIRQRDVATKPEERDDTSDKNKKLDAFIAKVSDNQMCDYWKSSEELTTKVSVALHKVFKKIPRIGWVRAENVTIMEELGKEDFFAKHNIYETVRDILWKESIDITSKKNTLVLILQYPN